MSLMICAHPPRVSTSVITAKKTISRKPSTRVLVTKYLESTRDATINTNAMYCYSLMKTGLMTIL